MHIRPHPTGERPARRRLIRRSSSLLGGVLIAAGVLAAGASSPALAEPNCPPPERPCIDPEPDPEDSPPGPGTVQFTARTTTSASPGAASFSFRLRIPAYARTWGLQRQLSSGWTTIRSGSSTGTPHYVSTSHTGLTPDARYCYRLLATNSHGSSTSPTVCAYTRDGRSIDVHRVQVRLETADISDAGAPDQSINVAVNGAYPYVSPEWTWLDHGRNDFERGDVHDYDLLLDRIGELGDITAVSVENTSSDDWCVRAVEVRVNGKTAFRHLFGTSTCRWLGQDSPSTRLVIPHSELRSSPSWRSYEYEWPYDVTTLGDGSIRITRTYTRSMIEQMIESTVGHSIQPNALYWGHSSGRSVEARRAATRVVGVDLDLAANVPGFDPEVDIDFELHASATLSPDGLPAANVTLENLDVDADYDWWQEFLSLGLVELVEDKIEDEVAGGFPDFDEHIEEDVEVDQFSVRVTAAGNIVYTAILR